ncbi:FHA domain-containing protein [Corallococcus sp. bb12-1]|uniref:FHA domain-containing protein n=1 Tax=Corallococcus sp. bb12-1 TaxID=2996784 RepID=UPI00227163CF|nr:FHA domain-containing protein [Corallococcus sp. bb12-1]MCY1043432.1 FHA domain-containing protein [Corallococcus sp. bb12-1]
MLKLIIEDDEGRKTVVPFVRDEITIGRQEGNTIRLTERNVSRRHARLVRLNGHVVLEDLGSYNGTRINGERVAGQLPLKEGDLIQIGDYDLALQVEGAAATAAPTGAITAKVPASRRADPDDEDDAPAAAAARADEEDEDDAEDGDEHDHTPPSAEMRRNATSIIRMDQMEADRPRKVERVPEDEQPRLLVLAPTEFKGQEYDCNRTELRIGRTSENDIALDHRSLSRTHAKIVREETGEWRVIDMQSANGMTVNGESYAQATLSHGDVIEMGHVKLRFVGPGTLAEDIAAQGRSGSKKMLVTAAVAFLSIAAGAALFVVKGEEWFGPSPTPPVVTDNQPPPETPKTPPETVTAPTPPETAPPETPPEVKVTEQDFENALQAGDFATAGTALETLRKTKGVPPPKAKDMQQRLTLETKAQQQLTLAEESFNSGKFAEAATALKATPANTVVFATRYSDLGAKLAAQQQAAQETPPPVEPPKPPAGTKASGQALESEYMQGKKPADVTRDIEEIQAKVRGLITQSPNEALAIAKDCAQLVSELPECHLMLGVVYAKLKNSKMSVSHYEKFLLLTSAGHSKRDLVVKALSKLNAAETPPGSQADKKNTQ